MLTVSQSQILEVTEYELQLLIVVHVRELF